MKFNHIYGRSIKDDEKLGWNKVTTPTTHKYNRYLNKRMSLKTSFSIILITGLIIWSFIYTGFSIGDLMIGLPQIGVFFKQMIPPDWGYSRSYYTTNARHDSYGNCRYFSWKYCSIL